MPDYLSHNLAYYSKPYEAENVDHPVFRFYGRILVPDFGLDGSGGEHVLDFGCGQGAAVNFFGSKGFGAYGVDISDVDLRRAGERYPDLADHFLRIDPKPQPDDEWFGGDYSVVVSIQTLCLLSQTDLEVRLESLYSQLRDGGIFYATVMGTKHWYYDNSTPAEDGMREVNISGKRLTVSSFFVNFNDSEEDVKRKFHMFEPLHLGFYSQKYRADEGAGFFYTFVGRKR
jgi:SAM-dependent methyltransferase